MASVCIIDCPAESVEPIDTLVLWPMQSWRPPENDPKCQSLYGGSEESSSDDVR